MMSDKPTQAEMERARLQRDDKNRLLIDVGDIGIYDKKHQSTAIGDDRRISIAVADYAIRKMRLA